MNYIKELLRWAEPGYRWTLETAGELALLAGRGCRWLGRFLLALLLFLPWLIVGIVLWLRRSNSTNPSTAETSNCINA